MKLSTKGRYAVMAMVDLAAGGGERPRALADIADQQQISLSYLEQLFAKLRRHGLVQAVRGPGGGYLLAQSPEKTRISDIVGAVDEALPSNRCTPVQPAGCRGRDTRCATHDLWEQLDEQVQIYLSSITLSDVVAGSLALPCTPQPSNHSAAVVEPA